MRLAREGASNAPCEFVCVHAPVEVQNERALVCSKTLGAHLAIVDEMENVNAPEGNGGAGRES
jgi:hypothetical protein